MRIHSKPVQVNKPTRDVSDNPSLSNNKGPFVKKTPADFVGDIRNSNLSYSPISRQELLTLASDFKRGLINRDQANTKLVSAVVNNFRDGQLSDKDRKKIIDAI